MECFIRTLCQLRAHSLPCWLVQRHRHTLRRYDQRPVATPSARVLSAEAHSQPTWRVCPGQPSLQLWNVQCRCCELVPILPRLQHKHQQLVDLRLQCRLLDQWRGFNAGLLWYARALCAALTVRIDAHTCRAGPGRGLANQCGSACAVNTYSTDGITCVSCPAGSATSGTGSTTCACLSGYASSGTAATLQCNGPSRPLSRPLNRALSHSGRLLRSIAPRATACAGGTYATAGSTSCSSTFVKSLSLAASAFPDTRTQPPPRNPRSQPALPTRSAPTWPPRAPAARLAAAATLARPRASATTAMPRAERVPAFCAAVRGRSAAAHADDTAPFAH